MTAEHRALRDALGQFATGVCLITVHPPGGAPQALTANSFSAVSLDPPLVLWSLQCSSDAYAVFAAPPVYAINVLASAQEALSGRYATRGGHQIDPAHCYPGENGAPLIRDALAVFECSLEANFPGGDHTIIVGRVTRFAIAGNADPLLFYGGAYRRLQPAEAR